MSERMGGPATTTVEEDMLLFDGDDFFDAYMGHREAVGGSTEAVDADIDQPQTPESMTWEDKLTALERRYGARVFTYKKYSGTVRDLVACPHFSLQLEDGVEAAASWLETHDGTPEDVVEDDGENEDEELRNSVEEDQPKSEPEKPVVREEKPQPEQKPELVVAAKELAGEPAAPDSVAETGPEARAVTSIEVVAIEPTRESPAPQENYDTAPVDKIVNVADEKGEPAATVDVKEVGIDRPEEIVVPLPVRDEIEVHIDLGRRAEKKPDVQVEDVAIEEQEVGGTNEIIEMREVVVSDEPSEVDFYTPDIVFDSEAAQDSKLANDAEIVRLDAGEDDKAEDELLDITETINEEEVAQFQNEQESIGDSLTPETLWQEQPDSLVERALENEIATEDGKEVSGPAIEQTVEIMQTEEIIRFVEFVGEQPAGEQGASTEALQERTTLLVKKIETLEQAKTAEACREAIAEIREELTALLLLMGYANANELAERLIRQYDIRQLKKHMIAIVQALSSPERVVPNGPFYAQIPLWHKCGIHVVGMVTRLRVA